MNEHLKLVLSGVALVALSGLPGMLVARRNQAGQGIATLLCVLGCALGLLGTLGSLAAGEVDRFSSSEYWRLPLGSFVVELDTLTCVFLLPVFLISLVGSLYGLGYWRQSEQPDNAARLQLFYGLLTASLAIVTLARNGVLFLVGWEVMAVSAFMLVNTEDEDDQVRSAAWLYLAASHLATLALFGMFALLKEVTGSFAFGSVAAGAASSGQLHAIFLLALLGFGLKAGIMPLHIWLPPAHASAPSHVSAMMSGVLIKMGVYGMIRITGFLPETPLAWGYTLVGLGAVSGILALSMAIGQLDLKRALAYSSIENIGIIFIGLGLAICGRAEGQSTWITLGLGGALLHVWNHALFKPLLFYCAGSVMHATGTRDVNLMGGLAKPMRWTSLAFLFGSVGACALPPLNGFVSELLIYLGIFQTLVTHGKDNLSTLVFAGPALAFIGALCLALFTQLYGVVFLGAGRSHVTDHAHESPKSMLVPLVPLVALMILIGVAPTMPLMPTPSAMPLMPTPSAGPLMPTPSAGPLMPTPAAAGDNVTGAATVAVSPASPYSVIGVIQRAVDGWAPHAPSGGAAVSLVNLAPLGWLGGVAMLLAGLTAVIGGWYRMRLRAAPVGGSGTWDCGYAQPTARMQYTSASFGQILVQLLSSMLWPRVSGPGVEGLFPRPGRFRITVADLVLNRVVDPSVHFFAWLFARLRLLQQGIIQIYLLYILAIILGLLIWS